MKKLLIPLSLVLLALIIVNLSTQKGLYARKPFVIFNNDFYGTTLETFSSESMKLKLVKVNTIHSFVNPSELPNKNLEANYDYFVDDGIYIDINGELNSIYLLISKDNEELFEQFDYYDETSDHTDKKYTIIGKTAIVIKEGVELLNNIDSNTQQTATTEYTDLNDMLVITGIKDTYFEVAVPYGTEEIIGYVSVDSLSIDIDDLVNGNQVSLIETDIYSEKEGSFIGKSSGIAEIVERENEWFLIKLYNKDESVWVKAEDVKFEMLN